MLKEIKPGLPSEGSSFCLDLLGKKGGKVKGPGFLNTHLKIHIPKGSVRTAQLLVPLRAYTKGLFAGPSLQTEVPLVDGAGVKVHLSLHPLPKCATQDGQTHPGSGRGNKPNSGRWETDARGGKGSADRKRLDARQVGAAGTGLIYSPESGHLGKGGVTSTPERLRQTLFEQQSPRGSPPPLRACPSSPPGSSSRWAAVLTARERGCPLTWGMPGAGRGEQALLKEGHAGTFRH